jgi:hypothetical protein
VQEEREVAAMKNNTKSVGTHDDEAVDVAQQVEIVVICCKALREPKFDLAEGMMQGLMFGTDSFTQEQRAFVHASIAGEWKQTGDAPRRPGGDLDWNSDLDEEDEEYEETEDYVDANKLRFEYQRDSATLTLEVRQHKAPSSTSMTGMAGMAGMAASAAMTQLGIHTADSDGTGGRTSLRSRGHGVVSSSSELVGRVNLSVEELRMSSGIPLWYELEPEGTVKLQINWLGIAGKGAGSASDDEGSDNSDSSGYSSCHSGSNEDDDDNSDDDAAAAAAAAAASSFPFVVLTVEAHRCKSLPAPRALAGCDESTSDRSLSDPMLSVTLCPTGLACTKGAAALATVMAAAAATTALGVVEQSEMALLAANIDPIVAHNIDPIAQGKHEGAPETEESIDGQERRRRSRLRRRSRRAVRFRRLHTLTSAQRCNHVTHQAVSGGMNPDWEGGNHQRLFMKSIASKFRLHFVFPIIDQDTGGTGEGRERRGVVGNTDLGLSGAGVGVDGEAFSQVERFCSSLLLRVHETKPTALLPRAVYLARSKVRAQEKALEQQQQVIRRGDLEARLTSFYAVHNPEKLGMVPALVDHFGDEARVNRRLQERYGGVDLHTDPDTAIAVIAAAKAKLATAGEVQPPSPPLSPVSPSPPSPPPIPQTLQLGEAKEGGKDEEGAGGSKKYMELFGGAGAGGERAKSTNDVTQGVGSSDGGNVTRVAPAAASTQVVRPTLKFIVQPMLSDTTEKASAARLLVRSSSAGAGYAGVSPSSEGYSTPRSADEGYCTPVSADDDDTDDDGDGDEGGTCGKDGKDEEEGGHPNIGDRAAAATKSAATTAQQPTPSTSGALGVGTGPGATPPPAACMCSSVEQQGGRFELGRTMVDLSMLRRSALFGMPLWHELDTEGSVLCTIRLGRGTYTQSVCDDDDNSQGIRTGGKRSRLSAYQQQQITKQIQEAVAASAAAAAADEAAEAEEVVFMDAESPSVTHADSPSVHAASSTPIGSHSKRKGERLSEQGKTFRPNDDTTGTNDDSSSSSDEGAPKMDVQERAEQQTADSDAPHLETHDLERRLRLYYGRYNPQKLTDGSLGAIIKWGIDHPDELEHRLVEQYGCGIREEAEAMSSDKQANEATTGSPGFQDISLD